MHNMYNKKRRHFVRLDDDGKIIFMITRIGTRRTRFYTALLYSVVERNI